MHGCQGGKPVTKLAVLALALGAALAVFAACGRPAPTEPSVITIQRASPPVLGPAPDDWITRDAEPPSDDPVERGEQLALVHGCAGCHSVDGEPGIGPTWQGIFGSREELEDGTAATVDADYITESIRTPALKVVKGFGPNSVMLAFDEETISAEEVSDIIAYIESLR